MSSKRIGIFVATMTGLAELCAEEIAAAIAARGRDAEIRLMDGLARSDLDGYDLLVVVSSTYGHGDIPDNGQGLYASIDDGAALAGKAFTVFALGDLTYADTFCHAGEKWDALFAAKGATRFAPVERHDASSGTLAEDRAGAWAADLLTMKVAA